MRWLFARINSLAAVPQDRPPQGRKHSRPKDVVACAEHRTNLTMRQLAPLFGTSAAMELSERPLGVFSRQLVLADTLDTERIEADYEAGVLTLRIPIAERAKPRKISIGGEAGRKQISG
ncbi:MULTISPECIES: Hsp20/alpha crystallin family protein [unclassified Streptomyces]|uniref:Hsp20/alpha crystallin family protein n=1 Tax=unclassified Streptomyces TaxID=2593676 RepID=UPI00352BEF92